MERRALSQAELERFIPHKGHAFFLCDAEVEGWSVRGTASWVATHPHLQGHFPGMPIVPGVYLVEAAAQLAGVAIHCAAGDSRPAEIGVLAGVRKSSFHRFVVPGQRVQFDLQVKAVPASAMYMASGTGHVDGAKVLTVDLTIASVAKDKMLEKA